MHDVKNTYISCLTTNLRYKDLLLHGTRRITNILQVQIVLDGEVDVDLLNYTTTPFSLDLNADEQVQFLPLLLPQDISFLLIYT